MEGVVFLGNRKLELRSFPDPAPGPRDVILEIKASGMCGTDLHAYRRKSSRHGPVIAGHEPCGIVVEVGSAVTEKEARIGDRMMNHHYDGCGVCHHCRSGWTQLCDEGAIYFGSGAGHGSHARYMKVPAHTLVALPSELSFKAGAAISCGTGTAFGAIKRLDLAGDETIAIFGQGPVGLSATQLASAMGARVLALDISEERRRLAACNGADEVIDPSAIDPVDTIKELTRGLGAHKSMDTSSAPSARRAAVGCLRAWGSACYVGVGGEVTLEVSPDLILRQINLMGHLTFSKNWQADCALFTVEKKIDVDALFTHEWTLAQAKVAYETLDQQNSGKGVFIL